MEENKTNLISINGNVNYTFNFDIRILKKFTSNIFLAIILLHPTIINSSNNYYQTGQVAIEKPTIQTKNRSDAANRRQKSTTIARRKKKRRRVCGTPHTCI
jgi:hypothetical protein